MSVTTTLLSDVIESVSRSRAAAGSVRDSAQTPQQSRSLYTVWYDGLQLVDTISDQVARSALADSSVSARLPIAPTIAVTRAFCAASERLWCGEIFNAGSGALNGPGQEAVDALRKSSSDEYQLLDQLLEARSAHATRVRDMTIAMVVLSLTTVLYLFQCFFLVMRGGFSEVERHLLAMTSGDLTTSPHPWGNDEAAHLMTTLALMQAALRSTVTDVRGASHGLVAASDEIASASSGLSRRSE